MLLFSFMLTSSYSQQVCWSWRVTVGEACACQERVHQTLWSSSRWNLTTWLNFVSQFITLFSSVRCKFTWESIFNAFLKSWGLLPGQLVDHFKPLQQSFAVTLFVLSLCGTFGVLDTCFPWTDHLRILDAWRGGAGTRGQAIFGSTSWKMGDFWTLSLELSAPF